MQKYNFLFLSIDFAIAYDPDVLITGFAKRSD